MRARRTKRIVFPTDFNLILDRVANIDPVSYGETRNYLNGAVSYLSPYISRGVISTKFVYEELLKRGLPLERILKFIQELTWRDYWQQVWKTKQDEINFDLKNRQEPVISYGVSSALHTAKTGIKVIDKAISDLYRTGYLHNHLRMYIASIACNIGKNYWKKPAQWMYYYLLDADWASNALSWQWVAGANSKKKYYANQENINNFCFDDQKNSFLDVAYEDFQELPVPEVLITSTMLRLTTPLPKKKKITVNPKLQTLIYNYYNLDPLWKKELTLNRILLLEPSVFRKYPVSKKSLEFMFSLAKNIEGIQIYVGEFDELVKEYDLDRIRYKEHPLNKHYKGIEEERDWMFSVNGYYPSFFFLEKMQKRIKVLIKQNVNIVWLKRDLRLQDHRALYEAEKQKTPYLIVFLFEPSFVNYQDTSLRHLQFQYHSILDLNKKLVEHNRNVEVFYAEAFEVFEYLESKYKIEKIYSYQESGIQLTWNRDKKIKSFCDRNKINWQEFQRDGIIRGLKNRDQWNQRWHATMHTPIIKNEYTVATLKPLNHPFQIPEKILSDLENYATDFQPAGEEYAWKYLYSFTAKRGFNYHRNISKPSESRISCSRLSPYLAWGNISVKQVFQFVGTHPNGTANDRAFSGMLTRLHWHCHFIQKFEVACSYETHCINIGYELLAHKKNEFYIKSWQDGNTGYPLIDACMKALHKTGWINFRMRAMLVSFFTLNLDQDWRWGVYHLSRLFLDYDPGIHFPQFQMQAGTTGINTVRLYNPIKNSKELDPKGVFIKKWLPELAAVPEAYIHEPWTMTMMEQVFCGVEIGTDYPLPIIDLKKSSQMAREKIWNHKKHPAVKAEKVKILQVHVNHNR